MRGGDEVQVLQDCSGVLRGRVPARACTDRLWLPAALAGCLVCWASFGLDTSAQTAETNQQDSAAGPGRQPSPGMFVAPNEQHPAVALPIWQKSNHQTYVSVGTERSFMGAAVTRAAALVVVDYDSRIVQFAAINRALLAASEDREDYLFLRLKASREVWAERAGGVADEDGKTLRDESSWSFWKEKVRENTGAWSAAFEHFNKPANSADGPFAQTNYLFDDQLYKHLRQLAREGHIWTRVIDLRDEKMVRELCRDMRANGMRLGVVDTSNVPDEGEAGPEAAGKYVVWFSTWAEANTLFLSTEIAKRPADTYWSYFAFTGRAVKGRDAETIKRWYVAEIAKLRADQETRALLDDPDVVTKVD
jgi:hypothetical protein